ncbi:MAG: hypothetical protein P4L85_01695 [Paludisphaera borealis]|uniref:hypothetical protein n=1 Tax=Paludisphaera borealis TaxID=1387353 RepID=UPI00284FEA16|nr:hypothetical protein [Paludisphaera borealis]MDR3618033.1 hypothetical protein [Paludisphaera borealis]
MSDIPLHSGKIQESPEFRRDHYRVYDENGFLSSFALAAPSNATLTTVVAVLFERFHGMLGTGYESKDMVVLLGPRIVAVVRAGANGQPEVTTFGS